MIPADGRQAGEQWWEKRRPVMMAQPRSLRDVETGRAGDQRGCHVPINEPGNASCHARIDQLY